MARIGILVVDDSEEWRRFVVSTIQKESDFDIVGEASDGLEAIEKAKTLKPDVILLDIGLPGINGIEVSKRLSPVAPASKIIFLSQNTDADVVKAALSNGTYGYILKANAGHELLPALTAVLQGKKFISHSLELYSSK